MEITNRRRVSLGLIKNLNIYEKLLHTTTYIANRVIWYLTQSSVFFKKECQNR